MSEPQLARPFRRTEKFWRHSKYLVPLDRTALCIGGAPPPTRLASAEHLAQQYPTRVRIHDLGMEDQWGAIAFRTIHRGQLQVRVADAHPQHQLRVTRYDDAGTVGRHSSLLGPENTLVAELGYYHPNGSSTRKTPLGRLNPMHWRYRWLGDLRNRTHIPAARYAPGTAVVLNNPWCHNYYHWMLEVAPRIMLMRAAGLAADWYVVECQSRYQRRVLELLGIPRERWIQPHYGLHLRADRLLRPSQPGTEAWRAMSAAIREKVGATGTESAGCEPSRRRRIYISRKSAAHRKLANEPELEQFLSRYGFESHSFENCDFARQAELLSQAEVVVAVHGAALANLIFAQRGTRVVEICPVNRYNIDCFPRVSHKMGLEHVTVMATSTRFRQHLRVELDDVHAAFDLIGITEGAQGMHRPRSLVTQRSGRARLSSGHPDLRCPADSQLLPPHPIAEC